MRAFAVPSALVALVAAQQSNPSVTSPASLTECQPAAFSAAGTNPPFFVAIIPGGNPSGAVIENLPNVDAAGTFTWLVNLQSGSNITVRITDSKGVVGYSAPLVVQAGTSSACVGQSASLVGQSAGATATGASVTGLATQSTTNAPTSSTGAAAAAGTTSSAGTTASSAGGAAGGSSAAPATTSARSGASALQVAGNAVGLVGAAILALVA